MCHVRILYSNVRVNVSKIYFFHINCRFFKHYIQDVRPKKGGPPVGPRLITRGDVPKSVYDGNLPTFKNLALSSE